MVEVPIQCEDCLNKHMAYVKYARYDTEVGKTFHRELLVCPKCRAMMTLFTGALILQRTQSGIGVRRVVPT